LACARALAAEGAAVVLADIDGERAREAAAALNAAAAGGAMAVVVDVTVAAQVEAAVATVLERHGRIDVLVNNAGYAIVKPFAEHTIDDLDRMYAVHVRGTALFTFAVAETMKLRRAGRIINVSSGGALGFASEHSVAYQTAKAAQAYFGRATALALGAHGVTVNTVVPGSVETGLWRRLDVAAVQRVTGGDAAELLAARAAESRLGRTVTPEEVARVVAFLAHPDSAAIHDQTIAVD
jgi:meso-butanediol dehydrogenase/(S,S)-butanediol dehydrogenase/diacetyl reductase